jgi:hypothetical protein
VKYGPRGQEVAVTLEGAGGALRRAVEDEGPRIPPDERERVFERLHRLDRDRASAVAGTGLGLAVVRELVARHGAAASWSRAAEAARVSSSSCLSRLDLLRRVWGYPSAVVTLTVDTHVAELRRKREDGPARPQHILTVRRWDIGCAADTVKVGVHRPVPQRRTMAEGSNPQGVPRLSRFLTDREASPPRGPWSN